MPHAVGVLAGWPEWWVVPWAILAAIIGVLYVGARYLSRWTFRATGVAVILVGLALLSGTDTPQEQLARPCRQADQDLAGGRVARAEAAYLRLALPRDPDPPLRFTGDYVDAQELGGEPCARDGLQEIHRRQAVPDPACRSADRLQAAGRVEEAEAAYVRLLRGDDATAYNCAHMGLDELEATSAAPDEATFDDVIVVRGENFAKRLTEAFPGVPAAPGPVTWGALLVVGVCIWRWLEIVNAGRELAPVSTTEVDGDSPGGDKPAGDPAPPGGDTPPASPGEGGAGGAAGAAGDEVVSATQFRHRLARAGLAVPAPLPGAAPDLSTLVGDTAFGDGWVGRAAAFLVGVAFPQRGVRLAATRVSRRSAVDGEGLAVEVSLLRSGDAVHINTFWGASQHDVLDRAAYGVAQQLTARCPRTPKWAHWGDANGEALYHFQQGVDHLAARALEDAEASFSRAASAAPGNSTIKVELAKVAEQKGDYPRAIELYLDILDRYGDLLIARYRLAAACALVRCWIAGLRHDRVMWRRLRSRLPTCLPPIDEADDDVVVASFLRLAGEQVRGLQRSLDWANLVRRSLARPTRPVYTRFLRHPVGERLAALRALDCSELAVTIRARGPHGAARAEFERHVDRVAARARGTQAHYNAACCYALLMPRPPALPDGGAWEEATREVAGKAVGQLRVALSDPDTPFPEGGLPWLLDDDPDLVHLRSHPIFGDWVEAAFNGGWEAPPHCRRTSELRQRMQVVHRAAAAACVEWDAAAAGAEAARWDALADWVCAPGGSWAIDGLHAAFGDLGDLGAQPSPDLAGADRRALDEAWRWVACVAVEVHHVPAGPANDAAFAVWAGLRKFAAQPQSDRCRARLVEALRRGPLGPAPTELAGAPA